MHVVVTGGAGFIGAHPCTTLLDRGDAVVCVADRVRDPVPVALTGSRSQAENHPLPIGEPETDGPRRDPRQPRSAPAALVAED